MSSTPERWIVWWRRTRGPRIRLLCIAHAGAGAVPFRAWATRLPAGIDLAAVLMPGRESRFVEPSHERIEPLVEELAAAVEVQLRPPFALFGDCFGAIVAFELARELQRRGNVHPDRLLVAAQPAPNRFARERSREEDELPLRERVARIGGTDPRILENEAVFAVVAPALAADFAIVDGYRFEPEPRLDTPISVIATRAAAEDVATFEAWDALTTADCSVDVADTDSFFSESAWTTLALLVGERILRTVPSTRRHGPR